MWLPEKPALMSFPRESQSSDAQPCLFPILGSFPGIRAGAIFKQQHKSSKQGLRNSTGVQPALVLISNTSLGNIMSLLSSLAHSQADHAIIGDPSTPHVDLSSS